MARIEMSDVYSIMEPLGWDCGGTIVTFTRNASFCSRCDAYESPRIRFENIKWIATPGISEVYDGTETFVLYVDNDGRNVYVGSHENR